MVITILISVSNEDPKSATHIIDNIANSGYPKGKLEIVFLVVDPQPKDTMRFNGPPVVKIKYFRDLVSALNGSGLEALGDLVIFADTKTRFAQGRLNSMAQSFYKQKDLKLFFGRDWFAIRNIKFQFPGDLSCAKTHILLFGYTKGWQIAGIPGKLNRIESLRFLYQLGKITLRNKIKVILGAICN